MTVKKRKLMAASTLVEAMLAMAIVLIVVTGSTLLFATGRGQVNVQKHCRAAAQLAAQKLEELKAGSYSSITVGTTANDPNNDPNLALDDMSYTRTTNTVDSGSYKTVTVDVSWRQGRILHDVNMVTCIAP